MKFLMMSVLLFSVTEVRWCTISSHEEAKCAAMKTAFASNSLPTLLRCVAHTSARVRFYSISAWYLIIIIIKLIRHTVFGMVPFKGAGS